MYCALQACTDFIFTLHFLTTDGVALVQAALPWAVGTKVKANTETNTCTKDSDGSWVAKGQAKKRN